jgi:signal transduction histidine kinase
MFILLDLLMKRIFFFVLTYLISACLYAQPLPKGNKLEDKTVNKLETVGDVYLSKCMYDSARYYYVKATSINNTAQLQYKIASTYRTEVLPENQKAILILRKLKNWKNIDSLLYAKVCYSIGLNYQDNQQYDSAKVYFERAIQIGDKYKYYRPCIELVNVYISNADMSTASKYAFDVLAKIEKDKSNEALPYIYYSLSNLHDSLGDYEKMLLYIQKTITVEKGNLYSKVLGDIYELMGLYYSRKSGQTENQAMKDKYAIKSIEYYTLSYKAFEKVKNPRGMAYQLTHIANRKIEMNKLDEAKEYFKTAEPLFLQLNNPNSMAGFYFPYGDFLFNYHIDKKKGLEYIHKAAVIWENGNKRNLAITYRALSVDYEELKNYKKSLYFARKYHELYDSIFDEKAAEELQNLNLKYETEKKETQLKQQEITILQGKQRYSALALVAALGLIVAGLGFMFYRHQQQKQIRQLETTFEQTTRQLQSFNYSVSHDLRHPLITSMGMIEKLHATRLSEEQKKYINKTADAINNMNLIIEAMLNLASIEKDELRIKNIDTEMLIGDVIESFQAPNVRYHIKQLPQHFKADVALIRQVFVNLISNAIKYSEQATTPTIEIEGAIENDVVRFKITDNGVGFDEKFSGKLFQLFGRLHQNIEGIGVGLVIVKRIIEKHGGKVSAYGSINAGASFMLELPQ